MPKKIRPLLGRILKKIAGKAGAKVVLEPEWNVVGQINFGNGRKRYFRYSSLDLNPLGASEISKDKDYANFFMKKMGYPTVPGRAFFSSAWCHAIGSRQNAGAAYRYARSLGFPLIVKPNSGTQGIGVVKVYNRREFYKALNFIFARDRAALVQKALTGRDYRLVVLDDKIISVYERSPLCVIGDGKSAIHQLIKRKQNKFLRDKRDTQIKIDDFRIKEKLKRQDLTLASRPEKGRKIYLLDNANLSAGGDAQDVTAATHKNYKKLAVKLTKDMGLRLCGVDLLIEGDIREWPRRFWILETNAAPGLDHYVTTGKKQREIVEIMYLEVLKSLK